MNSFGYQQSVLIMLCLVLMFALCIIGKIWWHKMQSKRRKKVVQDLHRLLRSIRAMHGYTKNLMAVPNQIRGKMDRFNISYEELGLKSSGDLDEVCFQSELRYATYVRGIEKNPKSFVQQVKT